MLDLDALSREVASPVRLALAAVRDNPPHEESPLPWAGEGPRVIGHNGIAVCYADEKDAAHIAAAVNSAPVLAAEVERLTALLAAARVAVAGIGLAFCSDACRSVSPSPGGFGWIGNCHCGAVGSNFARTKARRAVGLEGSHG